MSIASKLEKLATDITSAYGAINTKGGTIPSNKNTENLANAITSIPQGGGGGSVEEKDVNFYDYDGTLTNSYTKAEFLALTELPENPTHAGLTAQGWNWTLSDAKTHVTTYTKLDIGQMYITDDGKTRIYITLTNDDLAGLNLGICVNGSVTVDWGDTTSETITGSSEDDLIYTPHTYNQAGDYIIKITCNTGNSFTFKGINTNSTGVQTSDTIGSRILFKQITHTTTSWTVRSTLSFVIQKIELGSGITKFKGNAFSYNRNLATITLPNTISDLSVTSIFAYCGNLKCIIIPNGIIYTQYYFVQHCPNLSKIVLPNNIKVGNYFFNYCSSLKSLVIPEGSTSINGICSYCASLEAITLPNTVTTLTGGNFRSCYSLKQINALGVTTIGAYDFQQCYNLRSAKFSNNLNTITDGAFQQCNSLNYITNIDNVTTLNANAFTGCNNLVVDVPSNVTTILKSTFSYNYVTTMFHIPNKVTSIEAQAFEYCYNADFDFSNHTSIPTLANSNAFSGCKGKIIVPDSLYSTWITASNWSNLSSQIVKASEA